MNYAREKETSRALRAVAQVLPSKLTLCSFFALLFLGAVGLPRIMAADDSALSISVAHARPRLPMFLSVTCLRGLKCCSSKVRPPTSQLLPSEASAMTLASVTLPGWEGVSAEERMEIARVIQKQAAVRASRCDAFIAGYFLILQL
jgi:hypothetical protein